MSDSYERDLTPAEIAERTARRDELDDQRDALIASVVERRKEIRGLNASKRKLELELIDVRREIRSGKVIESPQMSFSITTPIVVPSAEHVARGDAFERAYPMARDAAALRAQLSIVLQGVLVPSVEVLGKWQPDTGIFDALAHWARTEHAYMNKTEIAKFHPEIELPPRPPMPIKLYELRGELQRAEFKRIAKRAAAGKPGKKAKRAKKSRRALPRVGVEQRA